MSELIILKLGGSIISDKSKPFTVNETNISRLIEEISNVTVPLIVIHGGGSFGHPVATKYDINAGYYDPSQIIGFAETRYAMEQLNNIILKAFMEKNLPAVSVQPSAITFTENGRIKDMDTEIISEMIEFGLIPVLYGDAVLDKKKGIAILSGDQIVNYLAIKLNAKKVIFCGDMDGVFLQEEGSAEAKIVQEVTYENFKDVLSACKRLNSDSYDVTGKMLGKLKEIEILIENGVEAIILNANKPDYVLKALKGEKVLGTYFFPKRKKE